MYLKRLKLLHSIFVGETEITLRRTHAGDAELAIDAPPTVKIEAGEARRLRLSQEPQEDPAHDTV